jgi:predicted metal-binding membrane protein
MILSIGNAQLVINRNVAINLLFVILLGVLAWYLMLGMDMPPPIGFVENSFSSWVMQGLMRSATGPGEMGHYLFLSSLMWMIMMIAMMTPAVVPVVILHAANLRGSENRYDTAFFVTGYLLSWIVYGLLCAGLQLAADSLDIIRGMQLQTTRGASALIFVICGVYQFTPLKQSCLRFCQSPLGFLLKNWRSGKMGAFIMGLRFGSYCVGCCWAIMLLMFAAGVMSLSAMALISVFILLERLLPVNYVVRILPGVLAIVYGVFIFYSPMV